MRLSSVTIPDDVLDDKLLVWAQLEHEIRVCADHYVRVKSGKTLHQFHDYATWYPSIDASQKYPGGKSVKDERVASQKDLLHSAIPTHRTLPHPFPFSSLFLGKL